MILHPFQVRGLAAIVEALTVHRRVLYVQPTGTGKTVVVARFIRDCIALGMRVLFVAHTREIVAQTVARLIADGLDRDAIGVCLGGDGVDLPDGTWAPADLARPVQVVGLQKFGAMRKAMGATPVRADVLVFDEAHRAAAGSYRALDEAYPAAKILGLTATPQRASGTTRTLKDSFDHLIVAAQPSELIASGHLAKPRVFTKSNNSLPHVDDLPTIAGDFDPRKLPSRVNTKRLVGDIAEHWKKHLQGRPTIAFAVNVPHSQNIAAALRTVGARAEHLDGKTPVARRKQILDDLGAGRLDVVCNCQVLVEGVDLPDVKGIILAVPTKSLTKFLQMIGRALRVTGQSPVVLEPKLFNDSISAKKQDVIFGTRPSVLHATS